MSPVLRGALPLDAARTGQILWQFQAGTDWVPDLYSLAETENFCRVMIDRGWMTVAETGGHVQGFIVRDGSEICSLYVAPEVQGHGVARLLLEDAKSKSSRLSLRAFAANSRARRFYRLAGFIPVGRGSGADNDENLPDIAYVWSEEAMT